MPECKGLKRGSCMAPSPLPQSPSFRKSGCLVLSGFGIKLLMRSGHLEIEDGIGLDRRKLRLPRVGHGLKRITVIGSDGFATFDAIRWITDVGASLIFLDRTGKVLFASGPTAPSDARLRRAQSL